MRRSNRTNNGDRGIGSFLSVVLVLFATTASLGSICVGDDGHVNLELRLWSDCGDESVATSGAWDDALPEAAPCCGPCLHMGGNDGEWVTAGTFAAKQLPAIPWFEAHGPGPLQARASDLVRRLAPRPRTPLGLASVVIRC